MHKRFILFLFLPILLIIGAPAFAENVPILNVSVDRGVPVTLSSPAASVFIANPEVADIQVMSPTSVMVFGKKTGETTLLATDSAGRTLFHRNVVVAQDLSDLRRELAAAIPGNKIAAEALPDGIVLTGQTRDPLAVEDARKIASRYITKDGAIINRIQVAGSNQILLRVRFAEMNRSVDKTFGINWSDLSTAGGFVFGLASGAPLTALSSIGSSSLSTLNSETTNPSTGLNATNGFGFSHQGSHWNVNGLIDAMAQDGLVTLLAEPNLTAMSGETANFLAGGQVPVLTPQQNGSISIQYISYGVSLEFTPTLVGENRINLHVKPEVSEPSSVGEVVTSEGTITAFITRKAETTVELGSGQSLAIAGLLDNSQNQAINKFPFLGDVPILGPLFRSSSFQNDQTELIIIVTPYVVKGGDSEQVMALPMDGYSPPSDSELLLGLRNSSGAPNARPMSGGTKAAPAGPGPNANTSMLNPDTHMAVAPTVSNNMTVDQPPVENTTNDEVATPAAAPIAAVDPATAEPPVPSMPPLTPASMNSMPTAKSPGSSSGPGGFILE